MILRKSMIACFTAKQLGFMFTIAGTGRYVSFSPDSMVRTLQIRTKIIAMIHSPALLSVVVSPTVQKRWSEGKKKLTTIR